MPSTEKNMMVFGQEGVSRYEVEVEEARGQRLSTTVLGTSLANAFEEAEEKMEAVDGKWKATSGKVLA